MADGAEDFNVVPNKRAKADVWKHFGLKKRKKDSMVVEGVAACLRCDAEIRCTGGGTSNMGTHIRRHHPDTSTTASPVPKSTTGLSNQPSIKDKMCQINQPPYPASSPKAINITHKIALWIAHDMIPFRMVDSPYLRDVIESLNPRYQVPSRKQFSETSIPGMYEVEKRKVQASLKEAEQVAITSDGWTSRSTRSYMTVTSHHINIDWELVSFCLQTRPLDESHTAENIASVLREAVDEWQIPQSCGFPPVVTDNAANVVKAVELLKSTAQIPCLAHTINLAVQKGLKVKRVSHVLAKIRRIVGFFHRNATANRVLANKADLLGLPAHKLIIDVVTRWNSAYDMVERFAEMQPAVYSTLTSKEISSVKEKDLNTLNDDDVSLAEELISLLKPMKDITAMLCTETEPTLSIVKPLLNQLAGSLTEPLTSDSVTVKEIKAIMRKDIQSRYEKQSDILNLATALDPRFKTLPSLSDEDRFEVYRVLTSEAAKLTGSIVKVKTEPGTDPAEPTPNTNDPPLPALPSLAEENIGDDGESLTLSPASVETVTKVKDEVVETKTVLENILGDVYLVKVEPAKSPLEQAELQVSAYRKEQTLHVAKSPLQWWKQHQHMFPLVAKVAKRVLCIPATSVPSERVFSTAGDIVTQQRSRIKPKNVDMLIFLKKNLTPKPKPKKTKKSA